MDKITDAQLAAYRAFERVRASSKYNMFDPRALLATGLTRDEFLYVMENFDALRKAAAAADAA